MNTNEVITFFKSLLIKTNKKSEKRAYESFIAILSDLKDKNLTTEELYSIETELDKLKSIMNTETEKKYLSKKLANFKKYLKDEFSLVSQGYYTAIGMSLGMCFGVAIGSSIGGSSGTALGVAFGMLIGLMIGKTKDDEVKKQNRTLRTKLH
jgi:tetrahydromethanopterin S-methyltransferase subunit G